MAYCEEGQDGLGALPMKARGVLVGGGFRPVVGSSLPLMLALAAERKRAADAAAAAKAAEKPPAISPTGAVPPPPSSPLDTYVPPTTRPRPDLAILPSAPTPILTAPAGPISVSVTTPSVEAAEAGVMPRGFGMLEAGIAAGLAALLGLAFSQQQKGRKR